MKSKQLGLSPVGILAMSCLFALAVILGLKLTTNYIDYFSVKGIFERMIEEPGYENMDYGEITNKLRSRIQVSGLRGFNFQDSVFIGEDDDGELLLEFSYVKREHILGNIDVLLMFDWSSNPDAVVSDKE